MTPLRLLRKADRHFARHDPAAIQQVRERLAADAERLRLGVATEENSAPSFSMSSPLVRAVLVQQVSSYLYRRFVKKP